MEAGAAAHILPQDGAEEVAVRVGGPPGRLLRGKHAIAPRVSAEVHHVGRRRRRRDQQLRAQQDEEDGVARGSAGLHVRTTELDYWRAS